MKQSSEAEAIRISGEQIIAPFKHPIIREEPLALFINDEPYVTLMRLPGNEKELIVGFLFTEGLINGIDDILYIKHCGSGQDEQNRVEVKLADTHHVESARKIEARSACGMCSRKLIDDLQQKLSPLTDPKPLISIATLRNIEQTLPAHQPEYKKTGAVHAAALYNASGELMLLLEDIGRHNALDKVIGHALMRGWELQDKIVVSTGRTSFEMAYKTLRAKIPVMASISAPTSMALELCRRLGLTLIGFFRREGFNIYSYPERIIKPGVY